MLLDGDGDGVGCEFDVLTEVAFCKTFAEPEQAACLDSLRGYLDSLARDDEEPEDYGSQTDYDDHAWQDKRQTVRIPGPTRRVTVGEDRVGTSGYRCC